ncbi:MAG TPA: prenyltransferase, partial [Mycobacterium sp.]|nr:prenyltransferase [Mycobacterium sp.]
MDKLDVPAVPGVLTPAQCRQTAQSIANTQESSGAIP